MGRDFDAPLSDLAGRGAILNYQLKNTTENDQKSEGEELGSFTLKDRASRILCEIW